MTEQEVLDYLISEYHPRAVVLAGSRAIEKHNSDSDWDLYVFTEENYKETIKRIGGEVLDITFRSWPQTENASLTNAYAPLTDVKILFDETDGVLEQILARSWALRAQGPREAYASACEARREKLGRWNLKIQKYANHPMVQLFYVGQLYHLVLRVWFENRNEWPLPPAEALAYIQKNDVSFYEKLEELLSTKGEHTVNVASQITKELQAIR